MKITVVPKWVLPFGYGLTLYKWVLVRKDGDVPYLIAHEACHVKQWTTIGLFKFPMMYLYYLVKFGYLDNPYEIEARREGQRNR